MSPLFIYNTLSRQKEKFIPHDPDHVKMYSCGPTVYDFLHIGNFRGVIFYNLVRNWIEELGYKVTFVYNYTDIDDKIIQRAIKEGVDSKEIAEKYIEEFEKDFNSLKLRKHDHNPRVTEHLDSIQKLIGTLIEKEKAYSADGDVLYSIKSFDGYGKLSNRNPEDLKAGVRIELGSQKRDPLDFALWKTAKPGEPSWPSPWGAGRPGWHIECSAMVQSILGDKIDIHGGGMDLIFPHHENEIAQSEGCTGHQFVKYWMHNNMINFSGAKMSKSLGNIRTGRSFLTEYNGEILKYMMLSVHYRSVTDFGPAAIDFAIQGLARIYSALATAQALIKSEIAGGVVADPAFSELTRQAWQQLSDSLNDDFNTPEVFARIFEVVRVFNSQVKRGVKPQPVLVAKALAFDQFIKKFGSLASLFMEPAEEFLRTLDRMLMKQKSIDEAEVEKLVAARWEARQQKDFAKSDELRAQLVQMGISVMDTAQGSIWEVTK